MPQHTPLTPGAVAAARSEKLARVCCALLFVMSSTLGGCRLAEKDRKFYDSACADVQACGPPQLIPEEPAVCCEIEQADYAEPTQLDPDAPLSYQELTLEEAIQHALAHARLMRDLGGTLVSPDTQQTVYDPAIAFSDARFGEEAALSAFDATLAASAFFEKNDRVFNNTFIGSSGQLVQDLGNVSFELRKRAATGTQMSVRHLIDSDYNNNVGNMFGNPSGEYQAIAEGEVRQPLLRGAGLQFNRIAGPGGQPGAMGGVLLARVRTDISLAEFEIGVRDLLANVENAYWDLYFAYRDLDAKKRARDYAYETYQTIMLYAKEGDDKGKKRNQNQALEQYWRYQSDVLNALNGRTTDGTRTNNGSSGGTGRSPVGVHLAERRLRLLMGMPINGGPVLRPIDEPVIAAVSFDWPTLVDQALATRPELRRQRWRVKQLELELIASKNLLMPQLDVVGRYRWRGFGDDLLSQSNQPFSSAYGNLADGNNQEWQVGVELEVPLGFRRAHNAVRNTEHQLARHRVILGEQKRDIVFGLSNASSEVQRAHSVVQAQYNRFLAAQAQVETLMAEEQLGQISVDLVLEAQRRVLDAEILYHQATVDYALSLRNVYFETGTLLEYNNVFLSEGPSPEKAYHDAIDLSKRRSRPLNYVKRDLVISRGPAE